MPRLPGFRRPHDDGEATVPPASAGRCPRCGTPYEPLQEYCLECGQRLPAGRGLVGSLATAWQRRFAWYPGDWIWPALLLLLLAAASTAIALAASAARRASTPTLAPQTTGAAGTATRPQPTTPQPTVSTGGPSTSTPTTTTPPPTTSPAPSGPISWPGGTSGYTVVLESIPSSSSRGAALGRAREADRAGLPQVGVLLSSDYASLHPGYWVVFSGVYSSRDEAQSAVPTARADGFPGAYPARVTR